MALHRLQDGTTLASDQIGPAFLSQSLKLLVLCLSQVFLVLIHQGITLLILDTGNLQSSGLRQSGAIA